MKNRILWITLAMMLGLSACSNSEATESQTEDEQPEKEENKKEDKDTVSLKELITDNRDNAWKEAYSEIVEDWNDEHGQDLSIGYELAYINDDDIPELVLTCDDEAWYALDMYTFIDDKAVHMYTGDTESQISPYLSPGCQGKGDAYIERSGIYLQMNGMMGCFATTAYKMEGDAFVDLFYYTYADASWDESNTDPYSYIIEYTPAGGKRITIEKNINADDEYYDVEAIPEAKDLEREFDFSFKDKKVLRFDNAMSYEEILERLDHKPYENNSDYATLYSDEIM